MRTNFEYFKRCHFVHDEQFVHHIDGYLEFALTSIKSQFSFLPSPTHSPTRAVPVTHKQNLNLSTMFKIIAASAIVLAVMPGLVLAHAQPAPLKVAMATRDVIAAAILLDGGATIRARFRVLQHPLG